jgi:hypothetical protein
VCGSCLGILTWSARMANLVNYFQGNYEYKYKNFTQSAYSLSIAYTARAVFVVSYAMDYLVLTAARLLVLDQMSDFAAPKEETARKWWTAAGRGVMAVCVLGNSVGLAANIASSVYHQRAADDMSKAYEFFAANKSSDGAKFDLSARETFQQALSIASYQSFCEVAVLMFVLAAYIVAGVLSARRIKKAVSVRAPPNIYTGRPNLFNAVNMY